MQVLLIAPRAGFLAEPAFVPPLGLLYLGAALERNGHTARVADLALDGAAISGHDPRLIGVSCTTATFPAARQVIANCRKEYPGIPVVVGGPHLSVRPGDIGKLGADWGGVGDGEIKINYLAGTLDRGFDVPEGFLPDVEEVDVNDVPIPARHLVPLQQYKCTLDGEPATSLVTQRGCPFNCAFCCRWSGTRKVRAREIGNVLDEVRQLKAAGFRSFVFHDDEINLLNERLLALCRMLRAEGIRFKCNGRADLLTEDQAQALKDAGCSWLCVGVESGNTELLKMAGKGTTPEINARARKLCREAGIKFKAFVIVGLPGETRETVEDTRRWLIENEVDDLTITMFVPFPGSRIYDRPRDYDITFDADYESQALTFRGAAGLDLPRVAHTAGLSAEELAELPERLEAEIRAELKLHRTYQVAS